MLEDNNIIYKYQYIYWNYVRFTLLNLIIYVIIDNGDDLMFDYIKGTVTYLKNNSIVVEAGGVGYLINVSNLFGLYRLDFLFAYFLYTIQPFLFR